MRLWRNIEILAAFTQQKLIQLRKHLAAIIFTYLLLGTSNSISQLHPYPIIKRQWTKPKILLRFGLGKILVLVAKQAARLSLITRTRRSASQNLQVLHYTRNRVVTAISSQ